MSNEVVTTPAKSNAAGVRVPPLAPGSLLRFRVIAYDPQTKKDEDCEIIEATSWHAAWATVRSRYNYPRRMIPIPAGALVFPIQANNGHEPRGGR